MHMNIQVNKISVLRGVKMSDKVNVSDKPVYYERKLSFDKLLGRKNCEIMYVDYERNFSDLINIQALNRNVLLTPISMKEYRKATGRLW